MSKKEEKDSYQYQVYKILEALYKNEKFFKIYQKGMEYQGYLIEKRQIDKIKSENDYQFIRPLLEINKLIGDIKVYIKEKKEKIQDIIPKKFNSSKELLKELNNNKLYLLIKQENMNELCNTNKSKGKEMKFKFENDSIIIIFNGDDKLVINNNQGIIEKNKNEQSDPTNSSTLSGNPHDGIKFKKDLEILIRIFYYNKYLKEKDNISSKNLDEGKILSAKRRFSK